MPPSKRIVFLLLLFQFGLVAFGSKKDSLLVITKGQSKDSIKAEAYFQLIKESDKNDVERVNSYYNEAIELGRKNNNVYIEAEANSFLSSYYYEKVKDYSNSLKYMRKCIELFEKDKNYIHLKFKYTFIARNIFEELGFTNEVIDALKKAAKYGKLAKNGDNGYELYVLGWFEATHGQPDSAIKHLNESLSLGLKLQPRDFTGQIELLNWIGNAYASKKEYQKALSFQQKACSLALETKNNYSINTSYRYMAQIYRALKMNDSAIYYGKKCADNFIKENSHVFKYYTSCNLIDWLVKDKKISEAQHYVDILKDTTGFNYKQEDELRSYVDLTMFRFYSEKKDPKTALEYLKDYVIVNDSVQKRIKRANIGEQNLKIEFQKQQENSKLEQQKKDFESKTELDKQKTFNYALGGISVFVIILLVLAYNIIKQKQSAYKEITFQKNEVEKQKLLVEVKNKEVTDSIHYAKRIQTALLANKEFIDNNIEQYFILFKPKDIVSGDFYWATKKDHLFYLAVCDCTGHGVPGAFMSLLSIGFLSEAINEKNIEKPDEVFGYVRDRIIKSISKDEQKDGFDGILMCFDNKANVITYAAANNAPVLVSDGNLLKQPCDKIPVGRSEALNNFSLHTLPAKKGDMIYLYTDGYADQFGGNGISEGGKKFKQRSLNELLLNISNTSLNDQKKNLHDTFENWKGILEQVDDVIVMGIRV